jgi:hypothetical protein
MLPSSPQHANASDFRDVGRTLSLWLPCAVLAAGLLAAAYDGDFYWAVFKGEYSVTEIATVLVLIVAIAYGVRSLAALFSLDRLLFAWVLLGTLGCLYFAGEEASWGQWFFRWTTPEGWGQINDQGETNLHNISGYGYLLDQLPRALLTLGAFAGGVCMPLWLRIRRRSLDPRRHWYWLWPTMACLPVALLSLLISDRSATIHALQQLGWLPTRLGAGEFKELFLGWFLMIYMVSLHERLRQLLSGASPG